jgi:DNA polymerase iota
VHKPNAQTTLLPPYFNPDESLLLPLSDNTSPSGDDAALDNVTYFLDDHEIEKIPGIGFKIAQKIRTHVLQRAPEVDQGFVYGATKEKVTVRDVRTHPGMGPETLERILAGPGTPQGLGGKIWGLINGCDDTEVGLARTVPTQISIEDSYTRLDTMDQVIKELRMLTESLMRRMHADLLEDEEEEEGDVAATEHITHVTENVKISKRWLAHPKTLRLSTRPRPPQNPDGSYNRSHSFARISRSASLPNFVFNLKESVEVLADRLVHESLVPLFKKLHPEKSGWNLSLVNVAVTGMAEGASEKGGAGRDISKMFKNQDNVLKEWRVVDEIGSVEMTMHEVVPETYPTVQAPKIPELSRGGSEDFPTLSQENSTQDNGWEVEVEDDEMLDDETFKCELCGAAMPIYATAAHGRWHIDG